MSTKINFKDKRIVFDGHSKTLKECQIVTAVCNVLSSSEDFRTIKYEDGYAEFENVSNINNLRFIPEPGSGTIIFNTTHIKSIHIWGGSFAIAEETDTFTTSPVNIDWGTEGGDVYIECEVDNGYTLTCAGLVNNGSGAFSVSDNVITCNMGTYTSVQRLNLTISVIPNGYVRIEPNTLYENADYYIDTSILPSSTDIESNITTEPYIYQAFAQEIAHFVILMYNGTKYYIGSDGGWTTSSGGSDVGCHINNGLIIKNDGTKTFDTLNINLTSSPDWLYVKAPVAQPVTHDMTITLGEGVESLEMNFTEPDLPKVNLRVYTYGDTSGTYTVIVKENNNEIFRDEDTSSSDNTLEVTQNSFIGIVIEGSPWYFTIYKDGSAVTEAGMDGQSYEFTIIENTTISIYCNYD